MLEVGRDVGYFQLAGGKKKSKERRVKYGTGPGMVGYPARYFVVMVPVLSI